MDYFTVTLEKFSSYEINGENKLPLSKVAKGNWGVDHDIGTWFHNDIHSCYDDHQTAYIGESIAPLILGKGSIVVTNNSAEMKYAASELVEKTVLCNQYEVWKTKNPNVFYRFLDNQAR